MSNGLQLLEMIPDEITRKVVTEWIVLRARDLELDEDSIFVKKIELGNDETPTTVFVDYLHKRSVAQVYFRLDTSQVVFEKR